MSLTILYRGALASCNYACGYCPFAKRQDTREQLAQDKTDLERFVNWVSQQETTISILFTPWGEALIRGYYRDAIAHLSQLPNVEKVVIQTNFSCSTSWLTKCNREKVAFWITYHPSEISLDKFLQKCQQLDQQRARYSVGIVGIKDNFTAIEQCRKQLPATTYLWINAYKREKAYYSSEDLAFLRKIDPHFDINNQYHPSLNQACNTGKSVISVDGNGDVTRCHFITKKIGNIYDKDLTECLTDRPCSNQTCGCYIGYIHMPHLGLDKVYEKRILERISAKNSSCYQVIS